MKFLNGLKTIAGTLGLVVVALNDSIHVLPDSWKPYVAGAAALLTALGVVHKVEKAQEQRAADARTIPPSGTALHDEG